MKTNYVLRSAKERKKRLAMALESSFGQQPPTTPVQPKRTSRSVHYDFILPPNFEEDVSGQPKMRSINELMTMEVFVEQLSRPQNCKKDKISLPDGLAEYLQMNDLLNYRFPWGYRDVVERLYADWAMVSHHFLPCTLGGNMIDCYSNGVRYPVAWRDVEKETMVANVRNKSSQDLILPTVLMELVLSVQNLVLPVLINTASTKELVLLMVKDAELEIKMHGDYFGMFIFEL
ncbi:hypothetical protein Tco_0537242 [Tanacetum coccineum]